jgi:antibiotic biosynthesis monooxygenase (ABM) superfamily enzyme
MTTKTKLTTSLKIWVVIYPSITLLLYLFGQLLAVLPLYQRTLLLTVFLVPWIVFAGLPLVNLFIQLASPKNTNNNPSYDKQATI